MNRLFMLLLFSLVAGCGQQEKIVQPKEPPLRPVRYTVVKAAGAERERTFTGSARAGFRSKMSFKVSGTIKKLSVKLGDQVRAGTLLAALDEKDYKLKVQQSEAALEQANAASRNAEARYGRVRSLYENNSISRSELDAARAAAEQAKASVQMLERQLEQAKLQVTYTRLIAPSNCSIAAVQAEVNENVAPGQAVVLVTYGASPEVELSMPEAYIALVEKGTTVQVAFDALPDRTFPAVVTEVGVAMRSISTTFPVVVRLLKDVAEIRPGMAASVVFRFDKYSDKERFLIPPFAVGEDTRGRFVYVIKELKDGIGKIARQEVKTGPLTSSGLEVFHGVKPGDVVVTAGVSKIKEGLKVKVSQP